MVKVRVPATSANLGVGYDCLGLALDDFATVTFEVIAEGLELRAVKKPTAMKRICFIRHL